VVGHGARSHLGLDLVMGFGLAGLSTHPHQDVVVSATGGQHSNCNCYSAVEGMCTTWFDDVWLDDLWRNSQCNWSCQGNKKCKIVLGMLGHKSNKTACQLPWRILFNSIIDDATCHTVVSL